MLWSMCLLTRCSLPGMVEVIYHLPVHRIVQYVIRLDYMTPVSVANVRSPLG